MEPYTTYWNGLYRDSPSSSTPRRGMNETLSRGVSPGKGSRGSKSIKAPTSLRQMTTNGETLGVLWSSAQQRLLKPHLWGAVLLHMRCTPALSVCMPSGSHP